MNPHYEKYKKSILKAVHKFQKANQKIVLWQCAKQRAKRAGFVFSILPEDIDIPESCPFLGCKLTNLRGQGRVWTNASVDRINPTQGYVKGNIQVISDLANRMKQNASPEQLIAFAKGVLTIYKK